VACHLLKWVHYQQDAEGRDIELRYFRDTDGREVDFVIAERDKPLTCIECKWSDTGCEAWQLAATGRKDFVTPEGIRVAPAPEFLRSLV
jgi:hypothetical protein